MTAAEVEDPRGHDDRDHDARQGGNEASRPPHLPLPLVAKPPPAGIFDLQASIAAWNWGESGRRSALSLPGPPAWTAKPPPSLLNCGSGKSGSPWLRMHAAKASIAARSLALGPFPSVPPLGSSLLQACWAA